MYLKNATQRVLANVYDFLDKNRGMKALPVFLCPYVKREDLADYECSDRLVIGKKALVPYHRPGAPIYLTFRNRLGKTVSGTVFQQIEEPDVVYVPTWMYQHLQITTNLIFFKTPTKPCTSITVRPQTNELFRLEGYIQKVGNALQKYNTISKGAKICLQLDDPAYVWIDAIAPDYCTTVELLNDTSIDIVLMESVEVQERKVYEAETAAAAEEEAQPIPFLASAGRHAKKTYRRAFCGAGHVLGYSHPAEPIRDLCLRAALKRIEAEKMRGILPKAATSPEASESPKSP